MTSDFIIDVTEADFEYQVLTYSQNMPVVVDFWAEWCAPCKILGPILETLTQEAQGEFRLAKVDVDQNQNLAIRYGVRSIPSVKAFRNGEVISEFLGVKPEPEIREFLRKIAPSQSDLKLEKAQSLLDLHNAQEAEICFREVLQEMSDNPTARLGLAKSLLLQGKGEEAESLLSNFPGSREYNSAQLLQPLASALVTKKNSQIFEFDNPLDAAFSTALHLVEMGNIEAAMDGLLDVLRENKNHRNGEVRQIFLGLLEILGENNPVTQQYRNELASVLF